METTGGNAGGGDSSCKFPFTYNDQQYSSCVGDNMVSNKSSFKISITYDVFVNVYVELTSIEAFTANDISYVSSPFWSVYLLYT